MSEPHHEPGDPQDDGRSRPDDQPSAADGPATSDASSGTASTDGAAGRRTEDESSGGAPARSGSAESRDSGAEQPVPPEPDNTAEGNEDSVSSVEQTDDFEQFRDDLDAVERRIAGEIDPGVRAMVVALAVFALLVSLVLPHAGAARGFDVLLFSEAAVTEHIGLPSRIFVWFVVVFGIGFSLLALMTRRWVLAWIAVAGSAIASAFGVFSIWHRQTPGLNNYVGAGPGIGLVVGTIAAVVLTFHWVRVVWSRTALQLAAEEQRRIAAAAEEDRDRRRLRGDSDS